MLNLVQRSANSNHSVIFNPTQRLFVLIKSTHAQGSNTNTSVAQTNTTEDLIQYLRGNTAWHMTVIYGQNKVIKS